MAASDSRVDFRGFVEDNELQELFECADIFVNPRDPHAVANDMVFPSKVMHYLQTGKTTVSTWTKGLDPVYRDVLIVAESESIQSFVKATKQAVAEIRKAKIDRSKRIADLLNGSRSWVFQAKRLNQFINAICKGSNEVIF